MYLAGILTAGMMNTGTADFATTFYNNGEISSESPMKGKGRVTTWNYHLKSGSLQEGLHYIFDESTVVQKKFLIEDYSSQTGLLEELVHSRAWTFKPERYRVAQNETGPDREVMAGEFFGLLKMLHFVMGPIQAVYFLMEKPEFTKEILACYEKASAICHEYGGHFFIHACSNPRRKDNQIVA